MTSDGLVQSVELCLGQVSAQGLPLTLLSFSSALGEVMLQSSVVAVWLLGVGAIAWRLYNRPQRNPEWVRKAVHIGTGNVILLAWWLQLPTWLGIVASVIFSGLTLISYVVPILPGINNVGRRSWGTFFYALSIGLLMAWFWPRGLPQFAALGILTMTWGDGLAGLIGKTWGRHRYRVWGMDKSWEGTATMALVSSAIAFMLLLPNVAAPLLGLLLTAIVMGLAAALLEAFSQGGIDNLTVPLGCAALAWRIVETFQWHPHLYFLS